LPAGRSEERSAGAPLAHADAVALVAAMRPQLVYAVCHGPNSFYYRVSFADESSSWVSSPVLQEVAPVLIIDFMHTQFEAHHLLGLAT
jgi:hypothetical protein